jgi:hypothetical protein
MNPQGRAMRIPPVIVVGGLSLALTTITTFGADPITADVVVYGDTSGGLSREFYHRVYDHYQTDDAWVHEPRACRL